MAPCPRPSFPLALVLLAGSCVGPGLVPPPGAERGLQLQEAPPPQELPAFVRESADEWVLLTSGEWLRGEVDALSRDTLEFDSEELDDLKLDWEDVARLHSKREFQVVFEDRSSATGAIDIDEEVARVTAGGEERLFRRADVQRIVVASAREIDRWTMDVDLGFTARRGNTDQTDTTFGLSARRRTPVTRLDLSVDVVESDLDGTQVAGYQRFRGNFDLFLTSRLFLTPVALELYHDRFQNIDLRVTPYSGLGYVFADRSQVEWSGSLGLGYRLTRFDSVAPGEDREEEETVAIVSTDLSSDLTEKLELEAGYTVQLGLDDIRRTQHSAEVKLDYDVWGDLDAFLGFSWTRVGDPMADAGGVAPEPDDFRVAVGLSWSL